MSCSCGNTCCKTKDTIVPVEEVERFAKECLRVVEVSEDMADILSKIFAENDKRGMHQYGLRCLDSYLSSIQEKHVEINIAPKILKESCATAWVDGCNCIGIIISDYCMKLAMKKAKKVGIGCVVCKGSNHYCSGVSYSSQATKEGLIGFVLTNAVPSVAMVGSIQPIIGSNSISLATPPHDRFILDMSISGASKEKIHKILKDEKPMPENWALDEFGRPTTDPNKAALLLPLGHPIFGYKGVGLGLLCEIFTSILAGADYGPVLLQKKDTKELNLSHCFIAIDPDFFAPCFPCRMTDLMEKIRNCETVEKYYKIVLPGDLERLNVNTVNAKNGIGYPPEWMENFLRIAQTYAVSPLKPLPPLEMIYRKI